MELSVYLSANVNDEPGKSSFDPLGEVYTSFGFERDRIPYTELKGDTGFIKSELFIKTKG